MCETFKALGKQRGGREALVLDSEDHAGVLGLKDLATTAAQKTEPKSALPAHAERTLPEAPRESEQARQHIAATENIFKLKGTVKEKVLNVLKDLERQLTERPNMTTSQEWLKGSIRRLMEADDRTYDPKEMKKKPYKAIINIFKQEVGKVLRNIEGGFPALRKTQGR